MKQPRQQLALGEIASGAEDHDHVVVWVLSGQVRSGLHPPIVPCHSSAPMPASAAVIGQTGCVSEQSGIDREKKLAAEAAAELVQDGMAVGLGTGSTVAYLLPALARRRLSIRCVATSVDTARKATELGLAVDSADTLETLDIAIDGADQITPDGWLVKGGGGAHTREKVVAASA